MSADSAAETHQAKLHKLEFYRSEIKHEFDLMSARVNSFVTSQSFLTIAYASAMNNANPHWEELFTLLFPTGLALLGIVTSLQAHEGIAAAADTIALWHVKQNALLKGDPTLEDYRLERLGRGSDPDSPVDEVHRRSVTFARLAPRVFLLAWCAFGILTILLHFL